MTGPRCRGPAGLDAGHHVGHYAGVTRYVPSSTLLDFLENVDWLRILGFLVHILIFCTRIILLTSTFQVNFPAW